MKSTDSVVRPGGRACCAALVLFVGFLTSGCGAPEGAGSVDLGAARKAAEEKGIKGPGGGLNPTQVPVRGKPGQTQTKGGLRGMTPKA